jgi:hypothetical protein
MSIGTLILLMIISACKNDSQLVVKKFSDASGKVVGDSVFFNDVLQKIVFNDTTLIVDSIVYKRFNNQSIQSINTYVNGKKTFENIEYYENGTIKTYSFLDDNADSFFYRRNYNEQGELIDKKGTPFFQGYLTEIDVNTLEIKAGRDMNIKIFYPNPPNYKAFLYVKVDDTTKGDVFYQNEYIRFLKTVSVSIKKKPQEKIWTLIDVWLELQGGGDTLYYNKPIYYKVVE